MTRALAPELTCLCLLCFDTFRWKIGVSAIFLRKNKRKLKEH